MKIIVTEDFGLSKEQQARLDSLGDVTYFDTQATSPEDWHKRVQGYDVVCAGFTGFKDAWVNLRDIFVSVPYIGVDFVDLDVASKNGLTISNSPGCNKHAVVEWAIGMMIYLAKDLESSINTQSSSAGKVAHAGRVGLAGKEVTILGRGSVGNAMATACVGLGMNVRIFARGDDIFESTREADFVINALGANPSTAQLLDASFFGQLKTGVFYVSIARSETEDIEALIANVASGRIRAVAHDNGSSPSGRIDNDAYIKLLAADRVYVTPHIAFNSDVSDASCNTTMIDNIEAYVNEKPQNVL